MATGNMHKTFGEDRTCTSEDMIADGQTHSSQYSAPQSIYYTKFTSLTCKGLDICPLPADVCDSCFRGGAGA